MKNAQGIELEDVRLPRQYAGRKWLEEQSCLCQEDRDLVHEAMRRAIWAGYRRVGVRPATYIGPGSERAIATIVYIDIGEGIVEIVYRPIDPTGTLHTPLDEMVVSDL